ncbi:MAG: hypothetical protein KJS97_07140 [Alphaproteobacteria bacterium]|nr:hypothetical protein [Alphaproteobacteria bacterium]
MTRTWTNMVKAWCLGVIAFGGGLALGAFAPTDGFAQFFYDLVAWPLDGAGGFDDGARFTVGILGAVTIGWGLTMLSAVDIAARYGAPVWRGLVMATTVWLVIDSAISVACGVPGNAVSNLVFYGLFLAPILAGGGLRATAADAPRTAMA